MKQISVGYGKMKLIKEKGKKEICHCGVELTCNEITYNNETKLQWQVDGKAHFNFDPATKTTTCKSTTQPTENKDFGTVSDFNDRRQLDILRGQCLNIAATVLSKRIDPVSPFLVFNLAKDLYEEAKKQKFLEWE